MSRPLHILLAAALVATVPALSAAPAAAQSADIQLVDHGWGGDRDGWATNWKRDNWRGGNRRHHRDRDFRPGFSFNFGVPFPRVYYRPERPRDCYREWDGRLYCRAY